MARVSRVNAWVPASIYTPRDTQWLWWPWLPAGHLTIVAGRGGSGKGLYIVDVIACVTKGKCWPLSREKAPLTRAILVETEDDTCETLIPRLIAAGADLEKVMIMSPPEFFRLPSTFIKDHGVGLVVLSPLVSCLEGIEDTNKELDVRARLEFLMQDHRGTAVAIIGLMHLNKKENLTTVERILGSGAFANYSRSVLFTINEPDNLTKRLTHEKYNLSMKADDLLFKPQVNFGQRNQYIKIAWSQPVEGNVDVDALLQKPRTSSNGHGADKVPAIIWLKGFLHAKGKVAKVGVIAAANAVGYKKVTIEKAQQEHRDEVQSEALGTDNKHPVWYLAATYDDL